MRNYYCYRRRLKCAAASYQNIKNTTTIASYFSSLKCATRQSSYMKLPREYICRCPTRSWLNFRETYRENRKNAERARVGLEHQKHGHSKNTNARFFQLFPKCRLYEQVDFRPPASVQRLRASAVLLARSRERVLSSNVSLLSRNTHLVERDKLQYPKRPFCRCSKFTLYRQK